MSRSERLRRSIVSGWIPRCARNNKIGRDDKMGREGRPESGGIKMRFVLVALLLCLCLPSAFAQSSRCRLYLADQSDYAEARGFYLDFEGSALAELPVFLAVADGTQWRVPRYVPGFEFDRDYHLQAAARGEREGRHYQVL